MNVSALMIVCVAQVGHNTRETNVISALENKNSEAKIKEHDGSAP